MKTLLTALLLTVSMNAFAQSQANVYAPYVDAFNPTIKQLNDRSKYDRGEKW